jgi:hypothetical protein
LLYFFTKRGWQAQVTDYLHDWGRRLAGRVEIVHYQDDLPPEELDGACIFSTLDPLTEKETARAEALWDALAERMGPERLLNHPRKTLRRNDLLRELADRGINRYRVHPMPPLPDAPRYPVFLREATRHTGALTPLLHTREQLEAAVENEVEEGKAPESLLVVEFLDTADEEGVYAKYGAFVVGDRIIPQPIAFSPDWMTKRYYLRAPARIEAERAYQEDNPHQERLRELARLAHVGYGRFDYAVAPDGDIQVWEINVTPVIMDPSNELRPSQMANHRRFAESIEAAFAELAGPG